jgi:hypothetical protein
MGGDKGVHSSMNPIQENINPDNTVKKEMMRIKIKQIQKLYLIIL